MGFELINSVYLPGGVADLHKLWAAPLQSLCLYGDKACQEIDAILAHRLDDACVLAKALGLSNDRLLSWSQKDCFWHELQTRIANIPLPRQTTP